MLFTGVLDVAYAVHAVLSLTAVGNIADDSSLRLDGASGITTFTSGDHIYAAVAAHSDNGVQILRIDITESDTTADTTPPTITLTGSNPVTITVGASYTDSNSRFKLILRYMTESFLQEKAVPCVGAESCSDRHAFALPPSVEQVAPGDATLTRMPRRAFAQTTTGLTATGRICNACGLKAEGARDASMSESDSRYAAPSSVGVHAYRGVVP